MAEKLRLHHVGVAVADMDQALQFYLGAFGFAQVSPTYDDPIQKVKVCFLTANNDSDFSIELISALESSSPVNGYLSKGVGAYHLCYQVNDLEAALAAARAKGCILLGSPAPAVAFGGRRIAWCCTPTKHLVEFLELEEGNMRGERQTEQSRLAATSSGGNSEGCSKL